eukprot:tig00021178_g19190.t1
MLPTEVLAVCFGFLDVGDRCRAGRVCSAWRAASLEPPLSASIELVVAADVWDGDVRLALAARAGRQWAGHSLNETLPPLEARALGGAVVQSVLSSAPCSELRTARLTVLFAAEPRPPRPAADDPPESAALAQALAAVPQLTRLEISAPFEPPGAFAEIARRLRLCDTLPSLRELRLRSGAPSAGSEEALGSLSSYTDLPAHPCLELLDCQLGAEESELEELPAALPALRRVREITVPGTRDLLRLAGAGVRFARCELLSADLSEAAASAALAACFRPGELPAGPPHPEVFFFSCRLDRWANPTPLPGARSLALHNCALSPSLLDWLAGGAHAATLRALVLSACPLAGGAAPADLVPFALRLPEGTQVTITLDGSWPAEGLGPLFAGVAASPRLLRDVELSWYAGLQGLDPEASAAVARYQEGRWRLQAGELEAGESAS